MFRRAVEAPWTLYFDGRPIRAHDGDSVASALLAAGVTATRETSVSGTPRGPWCMMGACFDCVAIIDGRRGVRTCMTPARESLRVDTQRG
jgi:D-hydroxyproline dehydrogenase subunit gamma